MTDQAKNHPTETATLKWAFSIAGRDLFGIVAILAIEVSVGVSSAAQALLFRAIIDSAVDQNMNGIARAAVGLVALVIAILLLGAANNYLKDRLGSTIENKFKHHLLEKLLIGDYAAAHTLHTGEWMTRLTSDTSIVANTVTSIIPNFAGILARLIAAAAVLVSFDPVLGAFVLLVGLVVIVPGGIMRKKFKSLHKTIQKAEGASRTYMQEGIESLLVVHSFAKEQETLGHADYLLDTYRAARLKRTRTGNVFSITRGILSKSVYGAAALWCIYGLYTATMTYGTLVAILQLVSQVQGPLGSVSAYIPRIYGALASAERLQQAEAALEAGGAAFVQNKNPETERFTAIGFNNVEFSYEKVEGDAQRRLEDTEETNDAPRSLDGTKSASIERFNQHPAQSTIHSISLRIPRGSYVAFAGPSGCGKSTALKLFMCLYPIQQGTRYFEDSTGTYALEEHARWLFAYVPQGNMLMSGTIRDVVAFGRPSLTQDSDAEIWEALRIACADDFVNELDAGLDTQLGERGAGLSEGQMQRIAIARAVYSERPVLLLDECTSALDEKTETKLLQNLRQMTNKTVIIVTHRPAALGIVDMVARFSENGIHVEECKGV